MQAVTSVILNLNTAASTDGDIGLSTNGVLNLNGAPLLCLPETRLFLRRMDVIEVDETGVINLRGILSLEHKDPFGDGGRHRTSAGCGLGGY